MNIHNIVLLHNLHRVTTEEFHNKCMSVKVHWFRNRELSLIECLRRNVEVRCLRLLQREKYKYQHTTLITCALNIFLGGFDTCTDYRKTYISWYFIQFSVLKNVVF